MLKQDDYVKGKLVEYGWRFGQSYIGAGGHVAGEMIMHTLANRTRIGWSSWLQTFDRIPHAMAELHVPTLVHPSIWEPNFLKLLQAVDGVFDGSVPDKSKGALYWGDLAKIESEWFRTNIVQAKKLNFEGVEIPAHERVANINGLNFWN